MLLEVKNLTKVYAEGENAATQALRGVSLEIIRGEFVAIMGPSGSGKSTLLQVLGFLDKPSGGEYRFEGRSYREYSPAEVAALRNRKFGFIFQAFNLLARATVWDNVRLPLLYSDVKESRWDELTRKAIESVGLANRLRHESSQLSGGEKQRVAIARALVLNPELIFADEPTGNLDSQSGSMVMEYIQRFHQQGRTVILITHETYPARRAQRIIKLKDGWIESDEKAGSRNHSHDFQK